MDTAWYRTLTRADRWLNTSQSNFSCVTEWPVSAIPQHLQQGVGAIGRALLGALLNNSRWLVPDAPKHSCRDVNLNSLYQNHVDHETLPRKVPKVRSQAKTLRRMQRRKEVGILSVHAMPHVDQTWLNSALAHCISFPHCYYCVFRLPLVKVAHEVEIDRSQATTWCGAKYTLKFWCNEGWIRSIPKAISPILTWVVTE